MWYTTYTWSSLIPRPLLTFLLLAIWLSRTVPQVTGELGESLGTIGAYLCLSFSYSYYLFSLKPR